MSDPESGWNDESQLDHSHLSHGSLGSDGSVFSAGRVSVASVASRASEHSAGLASEDRLDASSADMHCCVFQVAGELFGLDVGAVGEVFEIESVVPVPLAPAGVVGLTNLRGVALAVVNLASLMDVAAADATCDGLGPALVLWLDGMRLAVSIDLVESVVPVQSSSIRESDAVDEHPVVAGFLTQPDGRVVSVLDSFELTRRVQRLSLQGKQEAVEGSK
ncbi:MAG: chemotaxis protein CheW [Planctomycetota bacterium]